MDCSTGEAEGDLREGVVQVQRIMHGSKQTLGTLINEETLLLAKYLRRERKAWVPRSNIMRSKLLSKLGTRASSST